jgi:hypothetical protein
MHKKAMDIIKKKIENKLTGKGYIYSKELSSAKDDNISEIFKGKENCIEIFFDSDKNNFFLNLNDLENSEDSKKTLSMWLFNPKENNEQDVKSIVNDFEDSIDSLFKSGSGEIAKRPSSSSNKKKKISPEAFVSKFVEVFPQFSSELDAHKVHYKKLLPDTFMDEACGKYLEEILSTKKNNMLKKLFEIFNNSYNNGDTDVRSIITVTIFKRLLDNDNYNKIAKEYMSTELAKSWSFMQNVLKSAAKTSKI